MIDAEAGKAVIAPTPPRWVFYILPILRRSWWILVICVVTSVFVVGVGTTFTTRRYKATAVVYLVPVAGQEVRVQKVVDLDVNGYREVERFYRTELELMRSRPALIEVVDRYRALEYDDLDSDDAWRKLDASLSLIPRERSQLIDITVTHTSPERAAVLATLVAEVYVDRNLTTRQEASRVAKAWLEEKIDEYQTQVVTTAADLLEYKVEYDLVDIDEEVTALSASMKELDHSYGTVYTERVMLSKALESHDKLLARGQYGQLAEMLDTPVLSSLAERQSAADAEHSAVEMQFGAKHPEFKRSTAKLSKLDSDLRSKTRQVVDSERARLAMIESQEQGLLDQIEGTKAKLLERQRFQSGYETRKQEMNRSKAFLESLAKRRDELYLASRTQLNNAQVVEPAIAPRTPATPRVSLNLGLALIGGASLGTLLALLRFYIDDSITSPDDVTTYIDVPLLGTIPRLSRKLPGPDRDLATFREPDTPVAESTRALRAVLEFSPDGDDIRRILVTSAIESEGKTSTCVRLGIAAAERGKRVLVIDADRRRPRVHRAFGIENNDGLLSCLEGTRQPDEVVQATEVPRLFALTLGERSRHAGMLLGSDPVDALLDRLEEDFDLILIDSPPAAALTDAINLSKRVDGVLLVVRSGAVSRSVLRHAVARFRQVDARVLGIALNDVDPAKIGGSLARYYGYEYAYSYQADPGDGVDPTG